MALVIYGWKQYHQAKELHILTRHLQRKMSRTFVWSEAQAPIAETTTTPAREYPNLGTGYFFWPVAPPYLRTQEFWGGHPATDINTYFRR